ncbi:MAG: radical SAM family heme chaperone HemW [Candidatus Latescibacteria bacterium]|nr:radical SAM family heme chaperone HemW [Candidatus Latescibacterota bacterium]
MKPLGLYVHIPFCPQLCPYCAFASLTGQEHLHGRYARAVCADLDRTLDKGDKKRLVSVFFGGGTPSLVDPQWIGLVLAKAATLASLSADAEVTLEANPGTADAERFAALRALGCNRLSIGVQAFNDCDLKILGRVHSAAEAEQAVDLGRRAGFDNISLDLIWAVPGSPLNRWHATVERALALEPDHISAYALTIEEGTVFAQRQQQGRLSPVAEDGQAELFEWTAQRLIAAGFEHYEVSNFARPGRRSRHNWGYWTGAEYLGVGLSAHSYIDGRRSWRTRGLMDYIEAVEAGGEVEDGHEEIDAETARRERVWLGLRTDVGVRLDTDERRVLQGSERFRALIEADLAGWQEDHLRLTGKGFLVADALGVELTDMLERGL